MGSKERYGIWQRKVRDQRRWEEMQNYEWMVQKDGMYMKEDEE